MADLRVEMPCPACSSEVTFRLTSGLPQGQIIRGDQTDGGEKAYAKVKAIIGEQIEVGASKPVAPRFTFREKMVAAAALILTFFGHIPGLFGFQPVYTAPDNVLDPGLRGLAYLGSIAALVWGAINYQLVWSAIQTQYEIAGFVGACLVGLLYFAIGPHRSKTDDVALVLLATLLLASGGVRILVSAW
jgi:hypothetical protein